MVVCVVMMLVVGPAQADDTRVVVELSVADTSPSVPSGANWGWWDPSKYPGSWTPETDSSLGIADARILMSNRTYTVILSGEWYPELDAYGEVDADDGGDPLVQELTMKSAMYDLGLGMWLGRDPRNGAMPWIGATYMDISEERTSTPPVDSGLATSTERANAGLWGVAAGADASVTVWSSLDLCGRLLFRWASGTRDAWIQAPDPGGGGSGEVKVSDSIDHFMWGLDLGLRWHATRRVRLEAGWRFRDRSLDDGPASFSGPQLKAAIEF
jgi:hypothetical protein